MTKEMSPRMTDIVRSRVETLPVATLTDAIGQICGHRSHILDLVSPTPGRKLFGRVVTIRYIPYRADMSDDGGRNFARYFYEAIGDDAEGTVLVLDSSSQHDVSVGGGAKFSRLHNHRLAGMITDARIRDFNELAAFDPVFYCSGETVRAGKTNLMPVAANVPVSLYGTTVLPGDYIYAGPSGVVVIPSGHIEQILKSAAELDAEDKAVLSIIRQEDPKRVRNGGSGES